MIVGTINTIENNGSLAFISDNYHVLVFASYLGVQVEFLPVYANRHIIHALTRVAPSRLQVASQNPESIGQSAHQ